MDFLSESLQTGGPFSNTSVLGSFASEWASEVSELHVGTLLTVITTSMGKEKAWNKHLSELELALNIASD